MNIINIPVYRGTMRPKSTGSYFQDIYQERNEKVCDYKCMILKDDDIEKVNMKMDKIKQVMKSKVFICRVYILEGVDVQGSTDPQQYYLKININGRAFDYKEKTLQEEINTVPQFYFSAEYQLVIPGSGLIGVEVWQYNKQDGDVFVGWT